MATNVQVVLRQDVDHLGRSGELVKVKPGFARNFLIPRGLATLATRSNISKIEHERSIARARADKAREAMAEEAKALEGIRAQVAKEAGPEGKLYGSVTAQDVAESLELQGVNIDRRKLIMPDEPIKATGDYEVRIRFGLDVEAVLQLTVKTKA